MCKRITVLGAGSSGQATAAYLTMGGHEVTLCDAPQQFADLQEIRAAGGIRLHGGVKSDGPVMPHRLSHDIVQAVASSQTLLICTSAQRHDEIAQYLIQAGVREQNYLLIPGNLGSISLRRSLGAAGLTGFLTAELSSCLWACRMTGPGEVVVAFPPGPKALAAYPHTDTQRAVDAFGAFLEVEPARSVVETALNSPNVVSHVVGAVLNAVQVDRMAEKFRFFIDGMSESFLHCLDVLEQERNAVLTAAGLHIANPSSVAFMRRIMDYGNHPELDVFRSLDGPDSMAHRYVSEDAACGVAMLVSVARAYGIAVPLTEAVLELASQINGVDYYATGRTMENLSLSKSEITGG